MDFDMRMAVQFGAIFVSIVGGFVTARMQIKNLMEKMNSHEKRLISMDGRLDAAESSRAVIDSQIRVLSEISSVAALEKRNIIMTEVKVKTEMLQSEVELLRKLHNGTHP